MSRIDFFKFEKLHFCYHRNFYILKKEIFIFPKLNFAFSINQIISFLQIKTFFENRVLLFLQNRTNTFKKQEIHSVEHGICPIAEFASP